MVQLLYVYVQKLKYLTFGDDYEKINKGVLLYTKFLHTASQEKTDVTMMWKETLHYQHYIIIFK